MVRVRVERDQILPASAPIELPYRLQIGRSSVILQLDILYYYYMYVGAPIHLLPYMYRVQLPDT